VLLWIHAVIVYRRHRKLNYVLQLSSAESMSQPRGEKRGITLIGNKRNDAFRAQPQQRSTIAARQRHPSGEEFAGANNGTNTLS